jgi:CRISPR-associated exonuclease Cas4
MQRNGSRNGAARADPDLGPRTSRVLPRQCALIHLDGVWTDNAHTVRGAFGHRWVDTEGKRQQRGRQVLRSVPLWSERLNITGRADVVEITQDGHIVPVEYKIGTRHGRTADLQVCAQALCLEEMTGRSVPVGFIWYSTPRWRYRIDLDEQLRADTERSLTEIRQVITSGVLPAAVNDRRCDECQLADHCLPSLTSTHGIRRVTQYLASEVYKCDC